MTKSKKAFITVALVMLMAGFVFMGIGMAGNPGVIYYDNGFKIYAGDSDYEDISAEQFSTLSEIFIDVGYADVKFVQGEKFAVEISNRYENNPITYKFNNGRLEVLGKENVASINIGWWQWRIKSTVTVYIPANAHVDKVSVRVAAGKVEVGRFSADELFVRCNLGNMTLGNITTKTATLIVNAGAAQITDFKAEVFNHSNDMGDSRIIRLETAAFDIDMNMGKLTVRDSILGAAIVSNDMGDIELADVCVNGLNMKMALGSATVRGELRGLITVSNDMGDININSTLAEKEYDYDIDVSMGDSKLNGRKLSGRTNNGAVNKMILSCSMGSIRVNTK